MDDLKVPNPFEAAKILDALVSQMLKGIEARPDVQAVVYDRETMMTLLATKNEYQDDEYVGERREHTERVCLVSGRTKSDIIDDLRHHLIKQGQYSADILNNPEAPNPLDDPRLFDLAVSQMVKDLLEYPAGYAIVYDRETRAFCTATRNEYHDGRYVGERQEYMEHVCYITKYESTTTESVRRRMKRDLAEMRNDIEDYRKTVKDAKEGGWSGFGIGLAIFLALGLITGMMLAFLS